MFLKNIKFKNYKLKIKNKNVKNNFNILLREKNEVINSLKKKYFYSFNRNLVDKYKRYSNFRVIGLGGSSLGTQAINQFLRHKIKKKFTFVDNLEPKIKYNFKEKKFVNLIVSKSGNTIETIVNANILIKKKDKNIFITENKKSYLHILAQKLKADVVHHNNFIGGRYSVLSEVGMLPAQLMNLNPNKFKQFNLLIKNKNFVNNLISNVASTIYFLKQKKFNSIIINYDADSENLFKWYQQLIAESLGKHGKGLLPIVSNMPKDNHSVMQLYLDGFKNNFFTFFYVKEKESEKINSKDILISQKFIRNKNISDILYAQKQATEKVFTNKKIPFRSFEIQERTEKTLGELFSFFMLETILLGKCMKLNPFDQPAVELIKTETKKILT